MPQVQLSWGSATHIGQREENQDRFLAAPPVFAVADGMGGHAAGAEAAQQAVECLSTTVVEQPLTVAALQQAVRSADEAIRAFGTADAGKVGAGTTVAGLALVADGGALQWAVFHVGDSRVYRWSAQSWGQLTVDHSLVQVLIDSGHLSRESAVNHPQRNIVTRALGVGGGGDAEVTMVAVTAGQRFLACSDGLSNEVSDARLAEVVGGAGDPEAAAQLLVDEAVRNGGRDNVAAVVVHVGVVMPDGEGAGDDGAAGLATGVPLDGQADTAPIR